MRHPKASLRNIQAAPCPRRPARLHAATLPSAAAALALGLTLFSGVLAAQTWSPVRVRRDAACRTHFFDTSGMGSGNGLLVGYGNLSFGDALNDDPATRCAKFSQYKAEKVNFLRLWMRPSDGFFAYPFSGGKVDLDQFNPEFFQRLDDILTCAENAGIVVEVMLWDASTNWKGGGLNAPTSWASCGDNPSEDCRNVHHPDNHVRSSHGGGPIPGMRTEYSPKSDFAAWYATSGGDGSWWHYQLEYVRRVLQELRKHPNVTVEIKNEAADLTVANSWRQEAHAFLRSAQGAPELLLQSESVAPSRDDGFRQANIPTCTEGGVSGVVDMVSHHLPWAPVPGGCGDDVTGPETSKTYARAACRYEKYKGILVGANEIDPAQLPVIDYAVVRHVMWGLVMAGGVPYVENFHPSGNPNVDPKFGRDVTREISLFFNPPNGDAPPVERLMPIPTLIPGNSGHRYVLATGGHDEILVFVDDVAGNGTFTVSGNGGYAYNWFKADGASSAFQPVQYGTTWSFTPPDSTSRWALRIRPFDVQTSGIAGSGGGGGGGGGIPGTGPSDLRLVGDQDFVNLSWKNGTAPAAQVRILHWSSVGGQWQRINTFFPPVPPTQTTQTHVDSGPNGITHCYIVRYFFGQGEPFYDSNQVCVKMYSAPPAAPPTPVAPTNCVDTMRPLFSWDAAPKASGYYLVVKRVNDGSILVNDYNITATAYVPRWDLTPGKLLEWKVKACNNAGCGPYSEYVPFTAFCPPTQPPILGAPSGCVTGTQPTLTWQPVPGADGYRVVVFDATPGLGDPIVANAYPTTTSYVVSPPLVPGKEYRWKVRADHGAGEGPWSNSRYFTVGCTSTMPPGSAALWSPYGPVTTPAVTYTWEPARGAVDYQLYVWVLGGPVIFQQWYSGTQICGTQECSVTPAFAWPPDEYGWQVQARNANGVGPWSFNLPFSFGVPVTVSVDDVAVAEEASGLKKVTFIVSLSSAMTTPVSVDYATAECTADAPTDYYATDGRVTFLPGGSRNLPVDVWVKGDGVPEGDETFFVNLFNPVGVTISKAAGKGTILNDDASPAGPPRADFNADGRADLILRDANGNHSAYFADGCATGCTAPFNPPKPLTGTWTLVGTNDFDGDGKADFLWRNDTSGNFALWYLDGLNKGPAVAFPGVADLNQKVVGTGDFDHDGKVDILWHHAGTGAFSVWRMNGSVLLGSAPLEPGTLAPGWEVGAVGDLNGDGKPDLLLRNATNGQIDTWFLVNRLKVGGGPISNASTPDLGWKIASLADLDRNGSNDVIWQNATSGKIVTWFMTGTTKLCGAFLDTAPPADPTLKVVGPQ